MGDSSVITALVMFCAAYLLCCGCKRGAGILVSAFVLVTVLISSIKLLFLGCNPMQNPLHIHSPSGHAALSAAIYGAFALLAASQLAGWRRYIPAVCAILLISAIAVSRVWLGMHSVDEIIIGVMTGCIALGVVYRYMLRGKTVQQFSLPLLLFASFLAVAIFHGMRSPAEGIIHAIALHFHSYDPLCGKH